MTCPACGAQASEEARFCRRCGSPLIAPQRPEPTEGSEADQAGTPETATPSPRGRGGRRRAVAAVAVVAALSGGAIAFAALRSSSARTPSTLTAPGSEVTSSAAGPSPPDARAVAVASLVPAGTTPTDVLYGNLDGAGPEEIVVVAAGPKLGGLQIHEQQVFVFAWSGTGWTPVLDASAFPGGGRPILSPPGAGSDQEVTLLKLVDLQGDGSPEVVLAVGRVGGSTEPVDLWVLSDDTSSVTVALHLKDLVKVPGPGGTVKVEGDRVLAVQSPYCGAAPFCPGYQTTQVVGSNPGGIAVVRTTTEAIKAKSPAEAAEGLLWAWEQGDRIAALTVASTSAVDGLFAISPSGGDPVVDSCTPYTQPAWDCEWFDPSYPQSGGLGLGLFVDPAPDGGYTVTLLNASSSPGE